MKFHRQDSHKRAKLDSSWRKPRGLQSKMRLNKRGYALSPSVGYGNDSAKRGLVNGKQPVVVATLTELKALDVKTQAAILSGKLGDRKRSLLLAEAKKLNVIVINVKDIDASLKSIETTVAERKKVKDKREAKKVAAEKAKKKETLEKKAEKSDEEKKEEEKTEKEKVLTQKV